MPRHPLLQLVIVTILLLGLPLAGAFVAGEPVGRYLEFPPLTRYVSHAPFSWPAFVLVAAVAMAAGAGLAWVVWPRRPRPPAPTPGRLPWWGWLAVALVAVFWALAWTRLPWFEAFQRHTFTPLWLSYILLVNALTYGRTGRSLLTHRPAHLVALFPLSALFWWYFEYLNRFVQNWHYTGVSDFSPAVYVLHATLAFSTVLPAVMSTLELLRSFPALASTTLRVPFEPARPRRWAAAALVVSAAGIAGLGLWPNLLFPLLWVAPLVLLVSLQVLAGERTLLADLRAGNWRTVALAALAGLICGVLWELWNYYSAAKWVYSIPYVHRFEVFEMPLLGYAGYLPFGLECAVVAGLLDRWRGARS